MDPDSYNLPYEKVGKNEPVCIADEVPFEIPDSWEWVRFKNLVNYSMGKTPPRKESEYWEKPSFPWVSIADMIDGEVINNTKEQVNQFSFDNVFKGRISPAGTLLMSFKLTVGKVSVLGMDAFHNEAIISIYPYISDNNITRDFLFETLSLLSQAGDTKTAIKGNTLNSDSLDALFIPLPPINEQLRITRKLQELKNPIADYDVLETTSSKLAEDFPESLKKSILQQAVMGKLVQQDPNDEPACVLLERIRAEKQALIKAGKLKKDKHESIIYSRDNSHYEKVDNVEHCIDDEIPFDIPDNWIWTRFDAGTLYTTDYVANGSFASLRENVKTYKGPNYAIMIKTQDFANGFSHDLTYTDRAGFEFLSKSELHGGELMLSNIGASIGKAFIIPVLDCPMTLAPNAIVVKCINETMTLFIKYLMLSFYGQQVLKDFTAGTAMPKFSKTQLRNTLIPLPPIEEQKRILIQIETLFSYVDTL